MALFPRRPGPATSADAEGDEFGELPPARAPSGATSTGTPLRPIQLRDWEIPGGYAVAAVLILVAVLELTITTGKGAPKTTDSLLPIVAIVLAVGQAATIRLGNRLVTGMLGLFAGFLVFDAKVPHSLSVLKFAGFVIPAAYGFVVLQRHSIAVRAAQGPRRGRQPAGGRTRRGQKTPPEPTGPPPSRRYTPPKPKGEQTRRR